MQPIQKDFKEFIELLNSHGVKYLIAGAFAVAFHGYPRNTGDIDFFVESSSDNAEKLEQVLADFGMGNIGLSAKDFTEPDAIIQLGYPPYRIDLITSLSGVRFEDAWVSRVEADVDGLKMVFLGKDDLIRNKKETGRPKDMIDYDRLIGVRKRK